MARSQPLSASRYNKSPRALDAFRLLRTGLLIDPKSTMRLVARRHALWCGEEEAAVFGVDATDGGGLLARPSQPAASG